MGLVCIAAYQRLGMHARQPWNTPSKCQACRSLLLLLCSLCADDKMQTTQLVGFDILNIQPNLQKAVMEAPERLGAAFPTLADLAKRITWVHGDMYVH